MFRRKIKTSQGRLIECLWIKKNSTIVDTAKKIGHSPDRIIMWRARGKVPYDAVGPVSRKLGVSIFALNYEGMIKLLGKGPTWNQVVAKCKLPPEQEEYVLKGTHPSPVLSEIEDRL